jgi:photosystem II PsbM protein
MLGAGRVLAGVVMETNFLGILGAILAILVPSIFLVILYVQTASREGS